MVKTFIFRPITPFVLSQGFGEDKACIDNSTGKVFAKNPYRDSTPCPPNSHSIYSFMKGHNGLDLSIKRWTAIYAATPGRVAELSTEPEKGLGVGIITDNSYYCEELGRSVRFHMRYWHNAANNVIVGDRVMLGDLIAWADNTGYSSGDHLHFEIKPVNVLEVDITKCPIRWTNILQNNGYFGAIDPLPYMNKMYVLDAVSVIKSIRMKLANIVELLAELIRKGNLK